MPEFNDSVTVTKENGTGFSSRRPGDTIWRFRSTIDGVFQWGDGKKSNYALGPILCYAKDGVTPTRALFEMNADLPIGIVLNNANGASISITNEKGRLVIRDERKGRDAVIATIGEIDEHYES